MIVDFKATFSLSFHYMMFVVSSPNITTGQGVTICIGIVTNIRVVRSDISQVFGAIAILVYWQGI